MSEDRLARIESKLDKLSDAVVAIARTEEQIATIFTMQKAAETRLDTYSKELQAVRERSHDLMNKAIVMSSYVEKINKLEERIDDLKMDTHDNTMVVKRITWAAGVLFTGIVGLIISGYSI